MEVSFKRSTLSFVAPVLSQVQNMEQSQDLRIPDGMPEAGRVLCCWGQCVLRTKQWQGSQIQLSAGISVTVAYLPEEGGTLQRLQCWIPFQFRWDLPEDCSEGAFRVQCLPGNVDARLVSSGKLSVRARMSALAEVWCPEVREVYSPEGDCGDAEYLQQEYPMQLPREVGETTFALEDTLTLPSSAPSMERLIYGRMDPEISDTRVLGDRLVFRGKGNLHILYESSDGKLHRWDFEVPFSQYASLRHEYSPEAGVSILPAVTIFEPELADGAVSFRAELTGQYLIHDRQMVRLTQDAYLPGQSVRIQKSTLDIPAILETRRENIYGEQGIPMEGMDLVDSWINPEFPRLRAGESGTLVELPSSVQYLYSDPDGELHSGSSRIEGTMRYLVESDAKLSSFLSGGMRPEILNNGGSMMAQVTMPAELILLSGQGLPVVTGLELPDNRVKDPDRPSLILRRADGTLWDLARDNGSRVSAIRQANGLESEPVPGQMLLIPVV
ncbi:MAG: DUF3794 domain-containing protein [Oscillospiraceae bacterium]|nr:DUF3794 domain-containing protein [Oscillospiraceae bacterium]